MRGFTFGRCGIILSGALVALGALSAAELPPVPKTLEEAEKLNLEELIAYKQPGYLLEDPAGDYALFKRSQHIADAAFQIILHGGSAGTCTTCGEEYEKEGAAPATPTSGNALASHPREIIQGRENPLNKTGFTRMLEEVITEERANGIEPSHGVPHVWSQQFLKKYGRTSPMLASSKLMMALADGETNKYMVTGHEADLYNWIIAQPENSITFPELFRSSYRLSKGDVYLTLMTMENVLAHQWRNPHREQLPTTRRLKSITSGYNWDEDRFGTWYHLIGIMIFGYVEGGTRSQLIGLIEALGSHVLEPKVEKTQKRKLNLTGGPIGRELSNWIDSKNYENFKPDSALLSEDSYLNQNEDFRDRRKFTLDASIHAKTDPSDDRAFVRVATSGEALHDCKVELMPDAGLGFDATKVETIEHADLGTEGATFQVFEKSVRKVRGFVTCAGSEPRVFESR